MAEQLYALQDDLNMIAVKVFHLEKSHTYLDELVRIGHKCELEQTCQAAQMRRMEEDIRKLKSDVEFLKDQLSLVFQQLKLITDHLGLNKKKIKRKLN